MRGLLDDAVGESGPRGAALPQSGGGSCDTHPVHDSGPRNREGLSFGHCHVALVCCAALPLGQAGQSNGGVDLPPALIVLSLLASAMLLLSVNM